MVVVLPSCGKDRGGDGSGRGRSLPHRETSGLYVEAFPAAALVFHIRIVELEAFVQTLAREVKLGSVKVRHALRVDDDGDAVALELMILRSHVVGILELVRESGAAGGAHAQAQSHALPALGQEFRDVACRGLGERNRHRRLSGNRGWGGLYLGRRRIAGTMLL